MTHQAYLMKKWRCLVRRHRPQAFCEGDAAGILLLCQKLAGLDDQVSISLPQSRKQRLPLVFNDRFSRAAWTEKHAEPQTSKRQYKADRCNGQGECGRCKCHDGDRQGSKGDQPGGKAEDLQGGKGDARNKALSDGMMPQVFRSCCRAWRMRSASELMADVIGK